MVMLHIASREPRNSRRINPDKAIFMGVLIEVQLLSKAVLKFLKIMVGQIASLSC